MTQPNVLFIACDDMASIRCMMNRLMPTLDFPSIGRISGEGASFDRAYCTVPICGPARAATMTGLSPVETGILSNAPRWEWFLRPENLLTFKLRQSGYYVGTVGKVHHGYVPVSDDVYRALYDNAPFSFKKWTPERAEARRDGMGPNAYPAGSEDQFYDGQVRMETIRFLKEYDGQKPFWWECGFKAPHTPYEATEEYDAIVRAHDVVMPDAWKDGWEISDFSAVWMGKDFDRKRPCDWSGEEMEFWKNSVRNYAASMLMLDYNVGKVLDALDASAFADNTIVSFYSDHGYHLGDMGKWHKFTLWEQAALAPLSIKVPGMRAQRIDHPVSHHDLLATLLDYCGAEPRLNHRGRSLRPFIETGTSDRHDRMVPTFWFGCGSGVRGRYRATLNYDGTEEMFDVVDDPFCLRNLAPDHADWPALRADLVATMGEWGWSVVDNGTVNPAGGFGTTIYGNQGDPLVMPAKTVAYWGDVAISGRTPYYHEVYLNLTDGDRSYRIPPHVNGVRFSGEFTDSVATFYLGNTDTDFDVSITNAARMEIHMGEGDDSFWDDAANPVVVHAGPGTKTIERFGKKGGTFHAGVGNSHVSGGAGDDVFRGAYGTMHAFGLGGNDTLHTGHADVTCWLHEGKNAIFIEGGRNQINPGPGGDRIVILRTGLPQDLRGIDRDDMIDLSDFGHLPPPRWSSKNDNTHILRVCDEEITFRGLPLDTLKSRIKGYAA